MSLFFFFFSFPFFCSVSLTSRNHSADLITTLMSMHHMRAPDLMLTEIARVLNHRGIFVIREHDCAASNNVFSRQLDVMHGFYAVVWPRERELADFCGSHYAKYRSHAEWIQLITQCAPFELLDVN